MSNPPLMLSKREQALNEGLEYDTVDPSLPAKPRRTKSGLLDARSLRRTGRREQLNFKVTLEVAAEIRALMMRDDVPSLAEWLEEALAAYKTINQPAAIAIHAIKE